MESSGIELALRSVGEELAANGEHAAIVVVGGATLTVLNLVPRATDDVDVIAIADRSADGTLSLRDPVPLPPALVRAVRRVARDLGLPVDWLNADVGSQFHAGLPPSLPSDVTWRTYAALDVGFVGRRALIALKLFAAVDGSHGSVHTQDLIALAPGDAELQDAAAWVASQDASPHFADHIAEVIEYVKDRSR